MGWKIIEIEEADRLHLFLDNMVIKRNEDKIIIPISDIDVVLLNNFKLNLTIPLINALASNNSLVIVCDNKHLPSSLILPIIGNYNTLKILEKQINWNHKWKASVWKHIIEIKIDNQRKILEHINKKYASEQLIILKSQIKQYDVTNREGHASKIFWHGLFTIKFKRFEDDYINNLLNYGYTILRAYFTRSIIKKGLDPRISIFHKSFHNYFALASDLMEPFRIIIDWEVYKMFIKNEVNLYEHKQQLLTLFNNKIAIDGKLHFVNNAIDLFVDAIVNQTQLPEIVYGLTSEPV